MVGRDGPGVVPTAMPRSEVADGLEPGRARELHQPRGRGLSVSGVGGKPAFAPRHRIEQVYPSGAMRCCIQRSLHPGLQCPGPRSRYGQRHWCARLPAGGLSRAMASGWGAALPGSRRRPLQPVATMLLSRGMRRRPNTHETHCHRNGQQPCWTHSLCTAVPCARRMRCRSLLVHMVCPLVSLSCPHRRIVKLKQGHRLPARIFRAAATRKGRRGPA